ncbi:MAG: thioredoxin family protein [Planctomycetota bacterium]|nr:thioredoxin family protein [Planctomycetota bacterium]
MRKLLAFLILIPLCTACEQDVVEPKKSNRPTGVVIPFDTDNFIPLVIRTQQTVLVEFWGPNCPPCDRMEPILKELARDHQEFMIGKINAPAAQEVADRFQVTVVPTFLVFKGGEVTATLVGSQDKQVLLDALNGKLPEKKSVPAVPPEEKPQPENEPVGPPASQSSGEGETEPKPAEAN